MKNKICSDLNLIIKKKKKNLNLTLSLGKNKIREVLRSQKNEKRFFTLYILFFGNKANY